MNKNLKSEILQYLVDNSFNTPPSVREICAALGIKSTATVHRYLHELEDDGAINIDTGKRRNVSLNRESATLSVPIVGTVAAGAPILAAENIDGYIAFDNLRYKSSELFALRIQGESMRDAGILNGDYIVARRTPSCDDGDTIVALIEDEATCKKLYHTDGKIELRPCNPDYQPIMCEQVAVLGKVVGVVRYCE